MRCGEVQEYLADQFAGSLSNRLSATVQAYVRTHMMSCPECCEEMDHFGEMQKLLRSIPVEPCNADTMRARFDAWIDDREAKEVLPPATGFWPFTRPVRIVLGIAVLAAAVIAAHQTGKWIAGNKAAPEVPVQSPGPVIATDHATAERTTSAAAPSEPANVSGRVIFENGSDFSDSQSLGEISISPADNSNNVPAAIVKLDNDGRFSRTVSAGDYRFRIAVFSADYVIRSFTSGKTDLLKDSLNVRADYPAMVELRVMRKQDDGTGQISGTVLDGATNIPAQTERVLLCCFASGPAERISTSIRPDGTFVFNGIPAGHFMAELAGEKSLLLANPAVDVTSAGLSGLILFSASALVPIDVTVKLDTGERLPYKPDTSIVFTRDAGSFQVAASPMVGNLFRAFVPANDTYSVTVSNALPGYSIQSIVDDASTDLLHGGHLTAVAGPAPSPRIAITLTRN
jgi:anti-sigma factor RsiW